MIRYLKLWMLFARLSLIREMQYLTNFGISILVEISYIFAMIFILEIFFYQADSIGTWTKGEIYFIYGLFRVISATGSFIYRANFVRLNQLINSGEFDYVLLKPILPVFYATTRIVSFSRISQFIIGWAILVYAINLSNLRLTPVIIVIILLSIFFGILTRYSVGLLVAIPAFWFGRLSTVERLEITLFSTARYPRIVFPPFLRHFFTFVIPTLLLAAVPSEIIFGKASWTLSFIFIIASISIFSVSIYLFSVGVNNYHSASS